MLSRILVSVIGLIMLAAGVPKAQSDLDDFMAQVLAVRGESWKTLQQYVLEERETFQIVGPGGLPIYGFKREYSWFPRDGLFVRSPVRADGVALDEETRARAEADWIKSEERGEKRREERRAKEADAQPETTQARSSPDTVARSIEPQFVSASYFLKFKFDPGQYALVGHERFDDREVLRIEYYPTKLFKEGRARPNRKIRERDEQVEDKMEKTSLVTFWVDPSEHQIVRYEFKNVGWDFLPGRSLVRVNGLYASMRMGQPFAGVWLPQLIEMRFEMGTAAGDLDGRYRVDYHDYRLATVTTKVR